MTATAAFAVVNDLPRKRRDGIGVHKQKQAEEGCCRIERRDVTREQPLNRCLVRRRMRAGKLAGEQRSHGAGEKDADAADLVGQPEEALLGRAVKPLQEPALGQQGGRAAGCIGEQRRRVVVEFTRVSPRVRPINRPGWKQGPARSASTSPSRQPARPRAALLDKQHIQAEPSEPDSSARTITPQTFCPIRTHSPRTVSPYASIILLATWAAQPANAAAARAPPTATVAGQRSWWTPRPKLSHTSAPTSSATRPTNPSRTAPSVIVLGRCDSFPGSQSMCRNRENATDSEKKFARNVKLPNISGPAHADMMVCDNQRNRHRKSVGEQFGGISPTSECASNTRSGFNVVRRSYFQMKTMAIAMAFIP